MYRYAHTRTMKPGSSSPGTAISVSVDIGVPETLGLTGKDLRVYMGCATFTFPTSFPGILSHEHMQELPLAAYGNYSPVYMPNVKS